VGAVKAKDAKVLPVGAFVEGELYLSRMHFFRAHSCLYSFILFCFFIQELIRGHCLGMVTRDDSVTHKLCCGGAPPPPPRTRSRIALPRGAFRERAPKCAPSTKLRSLVFLGALRDRLGSERSLRRERTLPGRSLRSLLSPISRDN
jgi:hypothetical protein